MEDEEVLLEEAGVRVTPARVYLGEARVYPVSALESVCLTRSTLETRAVLWGVLLGVGVFLGALLILFGVFFSSLGIVNVFDEVDGVSPYEAFRMTAAGLGGFGLIGLLLIYLCYRLWRRFLKRTYRVTLRAQGDLVEVIVSPSRAQAARVLSALKQVMPAGSGAL